MLSKKKLCNELVEFAKIHLDSEFYRVYSNDEECFNRFEKILDSKPIDAISEVDYIINDLLIYGDMEGYGDRSLCDSFINLAYELNIYNKHFKENNKNVEKDI